MDSETPRRNSKWSRFLLVWALLLLLLGGIGCVVLYQYLAVYEVTRPEPIIESFLDANDTPSLLAQARENILFDVSEYEDAQDLYDSYLSAVDTTRSLTYRLDSGSSDTDRLLYTIRSGPSILCQIIMVPEGPSPGFNRHTWTVSKVCAAPITEILPSVMVTVDAISGMDLQLNGKQLSSVYASGDSIPISDLTRFESGLDPVPCFTRYEIGPLYGEITLADSWGNTISPDKTEPGSVHYQAAVSTQSLKVRAPEDLKIMINGVPLGSEDVSSSSLGVLEGLELYTLGEEVLTNVYRIDGLYTAPEVKAVDSDGNEISPVTVGENSFVFFHQNDPELESQQLGVVERYFDAYMDYSAHAFDATRYTNLLGKVFPQSNLYNYIFNSREAMYWASGTSAEYKDLRYEHFHRISDYCFTCTVLYSAEMTATSWYEQYSYSLENAYELSFVTQNGSWYAAGMDVIADS